MIKLTMYSAITSLLTVSLLGAIHAQAEQKLPPLSIDTSEVTVSGLSSGAFMTVQFYVVNSDIMSGAGIVAGGPYLCARSWDYASYLTNATGSCMTPLTPSSGPNTPHLVQLTTKLSAEDKIDDISNLADDKLYLFSGQADHTVTTTVMDQTYQYFLDLGLDKDNIEYITTVDAGHALITNDEEDSTCDVTKPPFINDCDIDQAEDILNHLYGSLKPAKDKLGGKIIEFSQTDFIGSSYTSMSESGFLYVPENCNKGGCRLHVAYHGCLQGYTVIGDLYYNTTGYNPVADANDIVVLYPQVQPSTKKPFNPQGCWDFWGYSQPNASAPDFYSKDAPQIKAVRAMIDRLAQPI